MQAQPIRDWHTYVAARDPEMLRALLAEDVVFLSPAVHTPQQGREITMKYLQAAMEVLGGPGFRYVDEWSAERSAVLEFETEIDGVIINGVDMIYWNQAGRITRFKVMIRPLKALNRVVELMGARLAQAQGVR